MLLLLLHDLDLIEGIRLASTVRAFDWDLGVRMGVGGRNYEHCCCACHRRALVRILPAFKTQTSMGRGSHWGPLGFPIFSKFGTTAHERFACHDLGTRHALCSDAWARAHVMDYHVRGCFRRRSTYSSD